MLELIEFCAWIWFVAVCLAGYFKEVDFYRLMEKVSPDYYRKVGRPTVDAYSMKRLLAGVVYSWRLLPQLPRDFPKEPQLRKQAGSIRKYGLVTVVIWFVIVAVEIAKGAG